MSDVTELNPEVKSPETWFVDFYLENGQVRPASLAANSLVEACEVAAQWIVKQNALAFYEGEPGEYYVSSIVHYKVYQEGKQNESATPSA